MVRADDVIDLTERRDLRDFEAALRRSGAALDDKSPPMPAWMHRLFARLHGAMGRGAAACKRRMEAMEAERARTEARDEDVGDGATD